MTCLHLMDIILHSHNFEDRILSPTPFKDWKLPVKVMLRTEVCSITTTERERERDKPVVTLFLWPPEMPRSISLPTTVSEHTSRPSTFRM